MAQRLTDIVKKKGPRDNVADMREALKGIPRGRYESTMDICRRTRLSNRVIPLMAEKFPEHAVAIRNAAGGPAWMWARTPADAKKLRDALKSQNG